MNLRRLVPALALAVVSLVPSLAAAQEVDVASAYDRLYGTSYRVQGGLEAMRQEVAAPTRTTYTLRDMRFVEVLAYDTSGTAPLVLRAQGQAIVLFDPGPWTAPSRGWRPGGPRRIDLAAVLAAHGIDPGTARFQLALDDVRLTAQNTHTLAAPRRGEFLLAHNGGGIDHEDADANEPLLRCSGGTATVRPVARWHLPARLHPPILPVEPAPAPRLPRLPARFTLRVGPDLR
ncbi:MAG: hypothetical protein U0325_05730 [Polyangiales bacterium]